MSKELIAFKRLQDCGTEIVAAVDEMLLAGEAPSRIAKWLQDEKGLLKDLQRASVKKNLERYRTRDLARKVKNKLKGVEDKPDVAIPKKKLSALAELEELVLVQQGRLNKSLVKEAELPGGILLKQVSDEGRLLKEMLVELGKLQLETGFLKRAPKSINGQVMDPTTGEIKQFSWTEEQQALFQQIDSLDFQRLEELPEAADGD
jgi:hypothetical protein